MDNIHLIPEFVNRHLSVKVGFEPGNGALFYFLGTWELYSGCGLECLGREVSCFAGLVFVAGL